MFWECISFLYLSLANADRKVLCPQRQQDIVIKDQERSPVINYNPLCLKSCLILVAIFLNAKSSAHVKGIADFSLNHSGIRK